MFQINRQNQIGIFRDIVDCNKTISFFLKMFYDRSMAKTQVLIPSLNGIWTFISLLCISKCHLLPRFRLVKRKLACFEICSLYQSYLLLLQGFYGGSMSITQVF